MTVTSSDFDPYFIAYSDPSEQPKGNVLSSYSSYTNSDGDPNFWMKFDHPIKDFSLDSYNGWFGFKLYGFDNNLNLVDFKYDIVPSPTYATAHISQTNNQEVSYLIFGGSLDSGYYDAWNGIDNIAFTSVPEPGCLAMLAGIAIPGSVFLLRRRKK